MKTRQLLAAITLGSAAAFTGLAHAAEAQPKQSVGEYASDAAITAKVKAAIVADKDLSALDIAVETNNGVVTLTGTVGTAFQADRAAIVTRGVDGVKQVKNDVKVEMARAK
ncbi:BON domain-containing protein [Bordetella avium]|uniref:Osmotically-inducible protein Y n=1 Tax=Bordetella avium (strain 197N) TaxID=360910 RepID=Q2L114_BORA1|nr:BON domain-containing protein [Bordetella avium]AZY48715.1 BON domain-containing protein [Bordetella avium]AZY52095.1 BON domain-containing protein [Bordetella avium]RIQ14022.1 BON domain-containing protein [Bordetella avium]RIQ17894.1 BON domain-containing protein [Bordetella avium]RIQ36371.1 BON domain-containing protein [Bordetella avium]